MAKLWYDPAAGGTQLKVWDDAQVLERSSIAADLASFQLFRDLDDNARTYLATGGIAGAGISGGWPDLASFDAYLDGEIDRFADLLDYFDYESRVETLTVRDGDWFLPEAVESVTHEEVGSEASFAIDNDGGGDPNAPLNSTYWQSNAAGARELVVRVRGYRKKLLGIRLRTNSGDARAQLQALEVRAANGLESLDDPGNVVATGVDVDDLANWYEVDFVKTARYVKLVASTSAHTNVDHLRIRSLQVRVGIINHEK